MQMPRKNAIVVLSIAAKGLVRDFGFVPNGTRVYYLDRSQPPLLTDMAIAIFDATKDKEWLAKAELELRGICSS